MINPNENEFAKETASPGDEGRPEPLLAAEERVLGNESETLAESSHYWQQGVEKARHAAERSELFVRENPVPAIVAALGLGVVIGWALRHALGPEEKSIETRPRLSELNWSILSLPFLWPFFRSVKDKYEDSAESVKDGVSRLRKNIDLTDYTKPIRKRWKAWTH